MKRGLSRSEFFRYGFARAVTSAVDVLRGADAPSAVPAPWTETRRHVRPPGALEPAAFLATCTRCSDCLTACPHLVIRKAGPELGEDLVGTPVIIPAENPCLMCADLPCIAACEPGALVPPAGGGFPAIGVAVVDAARCYMGQGQPCDYCATSCPVRPAAVDLGRPGTLPAVSSERCTGCGVCAQICPPSALRIEEP